MTLDLSTANSPAILYKCIGERCYAIQGFASEAYSNVEYKRYGLPFHSRAAAVAHASELAKQQDIPESEIFEDLGAGDS